MKDQVVKLLGKGMGTREIGRALKISPQRVSEIKAKLLNPPKRPAPPVAVPNLSLEHRQGLPEPQAPPNPPQAGRADLDEYARMMNKSVPLKMRVAATKRLINQDKNPAAAQRAVEHADAITGMIPDLKPSNIATVPIFALPGHSTPTVSRVRPGGIPGGEGK
jgi:hypothetical protein